MLPKRRVYSDDFQTPDWVVDYLVPYLRREWVIWECAKGRGNLVRALERKGFKVIGTDIREGYDFLSWEAEGYDCIVTNPPYSLKDEFLERCYELRKPFALLLPLTALETRRRQRLFKEYGVEVIVLPRRVNFEVPSGRGSRCWFPVGWFTDWLGIGRQLIFI
jgi:hypothetical protein